MSLLIESDLGEVEIHCNGEFRIVDPESGNESISTAASDDIPSLGSLRGALTGLKVTRGGELQIAWSSRLGLFVPSDESFEAWELAAGDLQLVSMPGGEVAVFDDPSRDAD